MNDRKRKRDSIILGLRNEEDFSEAWYDRTADYLTRVFGTIEFFFVNAVFFGIWIIWNSNIIPELHAFDPFPFGFLTMIVSLEAIFLSVIVLISQNRAGEISDVRQKLDFEVNIRAEEEITRVIHMLDEIHDHLGLDPHDDEELKQMKEKIDLQKLGEEILKRRK